MGGMYRGDYWRNGFCVSELKKLPTLATGQAADLKIDTGTMRVWLSRCGPEDGETQPIQFERLINGRWEELED